MSKPRYQTNDRHRFTLDGWYEADLIAEITYWETALGDPEEHDVDNIEDGEKQLEQFRKLLELFEVAFEEQRTDKVNYEDGTWV